MESIAKAIENQSSMFSEEESNYSYILSSAKMITYDTTGRFVLPSEFMQFAGISDKAIFVGQARRFQIWEPNKFEEKNKNAREKFIKSGLKVKP